MLNAADSRELCSVAGMFCDEATETADCAAAWMELETWAGLGALAPVRATAMDATGANGLAAAVEIEPLSRAVAGAVITDPAELVVTVPTTEPAELMTAVPMTEPTELVITASERVVLVTIDPPWAAVAGVVMVAPAELVTTLPVTEPAELVTTVPIVRPTELVTTAWWQVEHVVFATTGVVGTTMI